MAIRRLLVANRGEIAVRVFRTCRELGIGTVAVTAPDDAAPSMRASPTRRSRSRTISIRRSTSGPQGGRRGRDPSGLRLPRGECRLRRGRRRGRPHVGRASGAALRPGGDKLAAKRTANEAGVPVVPTGEAAELGFPLVVKAAAGGGGRGMRVVREPGELEEALAAARREAKAAFGDDAVFCERYLERPRHVEIQLLADAHGNVVALGERDCSVQRRHQKVLEESPSPALDPALRARDVRRGGRLRARDRLRERRDRRVHARRPGVLLPRAERADPGRAPGHEQVYGVDLVAWQLRIAARRAARASPERRGHAVEVRLYAEDPRTFLPQAGPPRAAPAAGRRSRGRGRRGGRRGRDRVRPDDREADRARRRRGRRRSTGSRPRSPRPRSAA